MATTLVLDLIWEAEFQPCSYISILQRKALTPRHFASLQELDEQIRGFHAHWQQVANRSTGATRAATSTTSCTASSTAINSRAQPEPLCVEEHQRPRRLYYTSGAAWSRYAVLRRTAPQRRGEL
jgi:hypothetical protein